MFYYTFLLNLLKQINVDNLIKLILFFLHFVILTIGVDFINSSEQTLKKPTKDSAPSEFTAPAISGKLFGISLQKKLLRNFRLLNRRKILAVSTQLKQL